MILSIITVNLNNLEGLRKTMQSIECQVFKDFEWVVVDGGSTDGSAELIKNSSDYISVWVSEPDNGIYHAMNKGIRMSHGEFLLFLNSGDCLMDKNVLDKAVPYLSGSDFVIGNIAHTNKKDAGVLDENSMSAGNLLFILMNYSLPHPASFIRKSLFQQYGYYREDLRIASDWSFFLDAIVLGKATVKFLPLVVSLFDDRGISSKNLQKGMKERQKVMNEKPVLPVIKKLLDFHLENYAILDALKGNKFVYQLFRIYFYFWRKKGKDKSKSFLTAGLNDQ